LGRFSSFVWRRWPRLWLLIGCGLALWLAGCAAPAAEQLSATATPPPSRAVTLIADGQTRQLTTGGATVAEVLAEAGVSLNPADLVEPPPAAPLPAAGSEAAPMIITVVRVTETTEVIPESVPFKRQIVRSAEMSPDDPPRIVQVGQAGLQEVTVRIVYHDGLEAERWPTAVEVVEPPRDEIVMVGVAAAQSAMRFAGRLAYIDSGRTVVLEGTTDAPRQLAVEGQLDGRVFQLSPDGDYLLYTVASDAPAGGESFRNALWVIPTAEGATGQSLQIENVLWAGWAPTAEPPRIAYTTARSVSLPPGWEANNDLWLLDLTFDGNQPAPFRVVETYPAAYSWWGGHYAWTPQGDRLAYAFADEVGLLDLSGIAGGLAVAEPARTVLHEFTEFDTGADWAWLPALSWSADGRYLAFTAHAGDDPQAGERFDLWVADTATRATTPLVEDAGIWSLSQWSPAAALPALRLASLRANEPVDDQDTADGGYSLWLADADGGNPARLFPPEGESSLFARSAQSLVWGPEADKVAFIFDDALHILDVATGDLFRAGADDGVSSHPTWSPYGALGE